MGTLYRLVGNDGNFTNFTGVAPASQVVTHGGVIDTWRAEFAIPITETTAFGDTFRSYRGGIFGGTGNCSGTPTGGGASVAPGAFNVDRRLGLSIALISADAGLDGTACQYTGTVVMGLVGLGVQKTGPQTLDYEFSFTGTITETWDIT